MSAFLSAMVMLLY